MTVDRGLQLILIGILLCFTVIGGPVGIVLLIAGIGMCVYSIYKAIKPHVQFPESTDDTADPSKMVPLSMHEDQNPTAFHFHRAIQLAGRAPKSDKTTET